MRNRIVLVIISISFIAISLMMIYSKEKILTEGAVIELETQPVDPRDLLRGDYVILNYKINNVDLHKGFGVTAPGREAFVQLERKDKYWEVKNVLPSRKPDMGIFIKGIVKNTSGRVEYGIESYFVPEGKGKKIEQFIRSRNKEKITVEVAVDKNGKAVIKGLLLNGKPYSFK